ncbi:hypothetical protein MKZ38_008397 [Zalerion maritima]|uniref:Uncharacterized protein n=1 Tax=Zalerion maritima TaxID=339359 RepID=A0AAD5WMR8_9PEZI|nr:hypothetical protein MKZ38_008397 [Zalerion maritima]
MSGLEVGALVVGIMALFPALKELWNEWKVIHRERRPAEIEKVDQSLTLSLPAIGSEYDSHLEAFGRRFKVGDETAQLALSQIKLAQQDNLITVLKHALLSSNTYAGTLDLLSLHASSENVRRDTIGAMSDLHQRLAVQQRPGRKLGPPAPPLPPYGVACREDPDDSGQGVKDTGGCRARGYRKCPHAAGSGQENLFKTKCPKCRVRVNKEIPGALVYMVGKMYLPWGHVLMLSHLVCECYGSLSKEQLMYACVFCHCTKQTYFKAKEVWCQKGLHQHMNKEHRDRAF